MYQMGESARVLDRDGQRVEEMALVPDQRAVTVVHAEELNADAILAGIRAGRSRVAESAAVALSVRVSVGKSLPLTAATGSVNR